MNITTTWHYPTRPGFVSAWDATKAAYDAKNGSGAFEALDLAARCLEIRRHVGGAA